MSGLINKQVGQTYKDLFHIDNANNGLDSTLRPLVGGNGEISPISLSISQAEIDFNGGLCTNPTLKRSQQAYKDYGTVTTSLSVDLSLGNVHRARLTNATTAVITFGSLPDGGYLFELIVIIRQVISGDTPGHITWPSTVIWPGATIPTLTNTTEVIDVFRFYTFNGGVFWLGSVVGQNYLA